MEEVKLSESERKVLDKVTAEVNAEINRRLAAGELVYEGDVMDEFMKRLFPVNDSFEKFEIVDLKFDNKGEAIL